MINLNIFGVVLSQRHSDEDMDMGSKRLFDLLPARALGWSGDGDQECCYSDYAHAWVTRHTAIEARSPARPRVGHDEVPLALPVTGWV